ncbi:MAG: hypothetical protein RLZZ253_1005 [Verrucomicrobiota bacterium]|jgi:putative PIN family toxin of toxin-antitoxin system
MIVCVDTNVMLSAIARQSPFAPLFKAILTGQIHLAVSVPILLEYEEIAAERGSAAFASKLMLWLSLVLQRQGSHLVNPAFQFQLIPSDADDNKFADCAVTANADYVITEDVHFAPLANQGYRTQPITPMDFIQRHLNPGP